MKARSLVLCMLMMFLGACSHVRLEARSDAQAPVSSGGANVQVQGGRGLAALLFGGMLVAGAAEDLRNPRPVPGMEPDRAISEQDCTRPIVLGDNLRCR